MTSTTPCEQAYHNIYRLICQCVSRHVRRCGGEWEEAFSRACLIFCRAYRNYRPEKGAVTTYMNIKITQGLKDSTWCDRAIAARAPGNLKNVPSSPQKSIGQMISEVSSDAAFVMGLALSPPLEVISLSGQRKRPRQVRGAIATFLKNLG